jgi:hypothetical protein
MNRSDPAEISLFNVVHFLPSPLSRLHREVQRLHNCYLTQVVFGNALGNIQGSVTGDVPTGSDVTHLTGSAERIC